MPLSWSDFDGSVIRGRAACRIEFRGRDGKDRVAPAPEQALYFERKALRRPFAVFVGNYIFAAAGPADRQDAAENFADIAHGDADRAARLGLAPDGQRLVVLTVSLSEALRFGARAAGRQRRSGRLPDWS